MSSGLRGAAGAEVFQGRPTEEKQSLSSPGSTGNALPSAHSQEGLPASDPVEGPRTLPPDMAD